MVELWTGRFENDDDKIGDGAVGARVRAREDLAAARTVIRGTSESVSILALFFGSVGVLG